MGGTGGDTGGSGTVACTVGTEKDIVRIEIVGGTV